MNFLPCLSEITEDNSLSNKDPVIIQFVTDQICTNSNCSLIVWSRIIKTNEELHDSDELIEDDKKGKKCGLPQKENALLHLLDRCRSEKI